MRTLMLERRISMFLFLREERTVWADRGRDHLVFMRHFPGDVETNLLLYSDPQSTYSIAHLLNTTSSTTTSPTYSGLQCEVSDGVETDCQQPSLSSPQVCQRTFQTVAILESHRVLAHTETFPCRLCGETQYSLSGLTRHVNKTHTDLVASNIQQMIQIPVVK